MTGKAHYRRKLLFQMPKRGICAEVGVWQGQFSNQILALTEPKMLHLIDPWKIQEDFEFRNYGGRAATTQPEMEKLYGRILKKFGPLPNVTIHRGYSEDVLRGFPDGYLDWIYIDGNHHYDCVSVDLWLAVQKVRSQGFITGDDYFWGQADGYPVKQAVQELLNRYPFLQPEVLPTGQYCLYKGPK